MPRNNFSGPNFFCFDIFLRQCIGVEIESLNSNCFWEYSVQSGKPKKYNHLYTLLCLSLLDVKNWKIVITFSLCDILAEQLRAAIHRWCLLLMKTLSESSLYVANRQISNSIIRHDTIKNKPVNILHAMCFT